MTATEKKWKSIVTILCLTKEKYLHLGWWWVFFSYQDLTNFIWPLVGYQVSVDLSKLIPYVHQPWKDKQNTPTKQVCWKQEQGNKRKKKNQFMTENKKRIFHWHEVNNISMASGQKATLVGNLKICNLAALISRIWSLTVHGVTQCNLLTWLHWSGAKESHFEREVHDQHLRETEDFILILCSDYNLHHFLVTTGQRGLVSPLRSAAPPLMILATMTAPVASSLRIVAPWWRRHKQHVDKSQEQ